MLFKTKEPVISRAIRLFEAAEGSSVGSGADRRENFASDSCQGGYKRENCTHGCYQGGYKHEDFASDSCQGGYRRENYTHGCRPNPRSGRVKCNMEREGLGGERGDGYEK